MIVVEGTTEDCTTVVKGFTTLVGGYTAMAEACTAIVDGFQGYMEAVDSYCLTPKSFRPNYFIRVLRLAEIR